MAERGGILFVSGRVVSWVGSGIGSMVWYGMVWLVRYDQTRGGLGVCRYVCRCRVSIYGLVVTGATGHKGNKGQGPQCGY